MAGKRKSTAVILQEAINATGGAASTTLGAARNHICQNYPDFKWADDWAAQIQGAKTAMLNQAGTLSLVAHNEREDHTEPDKPTTDITKTNSTAKPVVSIAAIQRAQTFIELIGRGSAAEALTALEFLQTFGSLDDIAENIAVWQRLLAAVDGQEQTALRVLAIFDPEAASATAADHAKLQTLRDAA